MNGIQNNLFPSTIIYPDAFIKNLPSGFDGIFNWEWIRGCFGETRIMPMDFDGVVEKNKNYLIFETKNMGVNIPQGQLMALDNLKFAKSFSVIKIWGKNSPVRWEICNRCGDIFRGEGVEELRGHIRDWFYWANNQK